MLPGLSCIQNVLVTFFSFSFSTNVVHKPVISFFKHVPYPFNQKRSLYYSVPSEKLFTFIIEHSLRTTYFIFSFFGSGCSSFDCYWTALFIYYSSVVLLFALFDVLSLNLTHFSQSFHAALVYLQAHCKFSRFLCITYFTEPLQCLAGIRHMCTFQRWLDKACAFAEPELRKNYRWAL